MGDTTGGVYGGGPGDLLKQLFYMTRLGQAAAQSQFYLSTAAERRQFEQQSRLRMEEQQGAQQDAGQLADIDASTFSNPEQALQAYTAFQPQSVQGRQWRAHGLKSAWEQAGKGAAMAAIQPKPGRPGSIRMPKEVEAGMVEAPPTPPALSGALLDSASISGEQTPTAPPREPIQRDAYPRRSPIETSETTPVTEAVDPTQIAKSLAYTPPVAPQFPTPQEALMAVPENRRGAAEPFIRQYMSVLKPPRTGETEPERADTAFGAAAQAAQVGTPGWEDRLMVELAKQPKGAGRAGFFQAWSGRRGQESTDARTQVTADDLRVVETHQTEISNWYNNLPDRHKQALLPAYQSAMAQLEAAKTNKKMLPEAIRAGRSLYGGYQQQVAFQEQVGRTIHQFDLADQRIKMQREQFEETMRRGDFGAAARLVSDARQSLARTEALIKDMEKDPQQAKSPYLAELKQRLAIMNADVEVLQRRAQQAVPAQNRPQRGEAATGAGPVLPPRVPPANKGRKTPQQEADEFLGSFR